MFQVLVVCTGNTCRSPMAEGILRSILPPDLAGRVSAVSAGTSAQEGMPAATFAIQAAAVRGIDIRGHRAQELTARLVRESDLILGMESAHVARVRELASDAVDRTFLITEQRTEAGHPPEAGISDPIGGGADEYDDTYHRIRSHLLRWLPVIRDAVERSEGVR